MGFVLLARTLERRLPRYHQPATARPGLSQREFWVQTVDDRPKDYDFRHRVASFSLALGPFYEGLVQGPDLHSRGLVSVQGRCLIQPQFH